MRMVSSQSLPICSESPGRWGGGDTLLNAPSGKSSQGFLSPWSPSALQIPPACDSAFLTQAHNPLLSPQTLQTPMVPMCKPFLLEEKGGGVSLVLLLAGPLLGEWSCRLCLVHSLWHPQAESPLLGSLTAARFPAPMPGNSAALSTPILPVTLGILRPHCPTRDSTPICCLSSFQAGTSLIGADF